MADHTIDEDLAQVTAADQGVDSLIAFVAVLKQKVIDVGTAENLSADTKAKLSAIFDMSAATAAKAQAAIEA